MYRITYTYIELFLIPFRLVISGFDCISRQSEGEASHCGGVTHLAVL